MSVDWFYNNYNYNQKYQLFLFVVVKYLQYMTSDAATLTSDVCYVSWGSEWCVYKRKSLDLIHTFIEFPTIQLSSGLSISKSFHLTIKA